MATTMSMTCSGCGASNATDTRRCRVCTRVINGHLVEPDRGLAALRPDVGWGTSFEGGPAFAPVRRPPSSGADQAGPASLGDHLDPEVEAMLHVVGKRWTSSPAPAALPLWEPTADSDADALARAQAIVLDAPLRNGATPPPIEHEAEHFDPDALDWDPPYR